MQYKENVDEHQKEQPNFKVGDHVWLQPQHTYQNNKAIREVGSSKVRSIPHDETNQCCGFPTQVSRFYANPSCVSCFLIGTLPCIYESKKNP
jgi:hypothetical protein